QIRGRRLETASCPEARTCPCGALSGMASRRMNAMRQTAPSDALPSARLTIIVPVLNERSVIVGLLASLAPFRERGVEVLVSDGGSNDGTLAAAAPGADRLIVAPPGRARQMNVGAAAPRAPVLLVLHAATPVPACAAELS